VLDKKWIPDKTRKVFDLFSSEKSLRDFVLIEGTALSIQLHHRLSEDLDFCFFSEKLNSRELDSLIQKISSSHQVHLLTPASKITQARINGYKLLDYSRDYLIDGTKVTFFARNDPAYEFFKTLSRTKTDTSFGIMDEDAIFSMKSWLLQHRVRSRDLFDLMQLIRHDKRPIESVFAQAERADPGNFSEEVIKQVLVGITPLDRDDEGFNSINVDVKMMDIYHFFSTMINDYEMREAEKIKSSLNSSPDQTEFKNSFDPSLW
jgi:predicted nucleotidyltransferase component of viral defense system